MEISSFSAKNLFDDWHRAGISYCHWKSIEHLSDGLAGNTDMDVLVKGEDKKRMDSCLKSNGFIHVRTQFGSRYPYVEDWIGIDGERGVMLHLHLHDRIITGHLGLKEYTLPWSDEALQTRVYDEGSSTYVIEPNLELLSLYTRIGLKAEFAAFILARFGRYSIADNMMKEIVYLKKRCSYKKLKELAQKYYGEKTNELLGLIDQEVYDAKWFCSLVSFMRRKGRGFNRYGPVVTIFLQMYFKTAVLARYAIRKVFRDLPVRKTLDGDGVIVAFVGQDGAGKSTLTKDALDWLSWKLEARVVYLGSGDGYHNWKKGILSMLKEKNGRFAKSVRMLVLLHYFKDSARHAHQQMKRAHRLKRRGFIVLLDRIPQMQYQGINDGPKIRNAMKKHTAGAIVKRYVHKMADREEDHLKKAVRIIPDLVFKLILSVEESMKRKPDEDRATVMEKHKIIKNMHFQGSHVEEVSADMNLEKEKVLIHNDIWRQVLEMQTGKR